MKIRQVEVQLLQAEDGRTNRGTDKTKLIVAFRNFATVSKNRRLTPTQYANA